MPPGLADLRAGSLVYGIGCQSGAPAKSKFPVTNAGSEPSLAMTHTSSSAMYAIRSPLGDQAGHPGPRSVAPQPCRAPRALQLAVGVSLPIAPVVAGHASVAFTVRSTDTPSRNICAAAEAVAVACGER